MTPAADRTYFAAFLNLSGKPGIVVGGGVVAANKTETLLRSGVRVTVVAPELCPRLAELARRGAIRHAAKRFQPEDLAGTEVVVAATDDASVNEAVSGAARALRVQVNVADNAALSSFIMPALVDRAPVQIAISTGGASPVLARKLRAMIETAVPHAFGRLAALIAGFRKASKRRYRDPAARRRFWERVVDGPVAEMVLAGREGPAREALERELKEEPEGKTPPGMVYLVGAGPGNPDLLTLRALRVLQIADVVLYDERVSPAILELARREAERLRASDDSGPLTQNEISERLVKLAREGKRVVHLSEGDAPHSGRGKEEIEALARHGIAFEVVPGVTADSAPGA